MFKARQLGLRPKAFTKTTERFEAADLDRWGALCTGAAFAAVVGAHVQLRVATAGRLLKNCRSPPPHTHTQARRACSCGPRDQGRRTAPGGPAVPRLLRRACAAAERIRVTRAAAGERITHLWGVNIPAVCACEGAGQHCCVNLRLLSEHGWGGSGFLCKKQLHRARAAAQVGADAAYDLLGTHVHSTSPRRTPHSCARAASRCCPATSPRRSRRRASR